MGGRLSRAVQKLPVKTLARLAWACAVLAVIPPLLDLLILEFQHRVANAAFLILTPIFGTLAKVFAGGAFAVDRDKWRTLFILLLVGSATLLLLAFGDLAGVKIRL